MSKSRPISGDPRKLASFLTVRMAAAICRARAPRQGTYPRISGQPFPRGAPCGAGSPACFSLQALGDGAGVPIGFVFARTIVPPLPAEAPRWRPNWLCSVYRDGFRSGHLWEGKSGISLKLGSFRQIARAGAQPQNWLCSYQSESALPTGRAQNTASASGMRDTTL